MTRIHPFFASAIAERYNDSTVPEPLYVEKVWFIAERNADILLMCEILKSKKVTPVVLERAKLRKEEAIRIIYLLHPQTDPESIRSLLENEGRSEVFAGLVQGGKDNKVLSDLLIAKIAKKPTKILAREIVGSRFPDPRAQVAALKVLAGDRRLPDKVISSKNIMIKNLLTTSEYASDIIDNMTATELLNHEYGKLSAENLHKLVVKFLSAATKTDNSNSRYFVRYLLDALMAIIALPATGSETFLLLNSVEFADWFLKAQGSSDQSSYCSRFQTVMSSSTMTILAGAVDEVYSSAKVTKGNELDRLMNLVVASDKSSNIVEGLLENPHALKHILATSLVKVASPLNLAVAMERSRSTALFKLIWREKGLGTPIKCWEFLHDPSAMVVELSKEVYVVNPNVPTHKNNQAVEALFSFVVPDQAVLDMPWEIVSNNSSRYSSVLSGPVRSKIMEMQLKILGESTDKWETFNNFALVWTGTFGSLLQASVAI